MVIIARRLVFSTKEWIRILEKNGFEYQRTKGDHYIYRRGKDVVVATKDPNCMMTRRLIKEYNLIV